MDRGAIVRAAPCLGSAGACLQAETIGAGHSVGRAAAAGRSCPGLASRTLMLTSVEAPAVRIEVEHAQPGAYSRQWRVAWRITNLGAQPLQLDDAWIPHGRFRGEGHIPLTLSVGQGDSRRIELNVAADEPPGTIVENAYLILRTLHWRLFARMTVTFDAAGAPRPVVETVTFQSLQ